MLNYTHTDSTKHPHVDIVIVNWNGLRYLPACLNALSAQTYSDFSIWIVDNGSTDGSVEYVRNQHPSVQLICNATNLGFAAANNQVFRTAHSEYIAPLNNDTVVDPGWLSALVEAMAQHPRAGMAAAKMLFAASPGLINSAGIAVDRLGIAWDRLGGRPESASETSPTPVFGVSAGAALYRRAMLDDIGLFDEGFFAYLEDVDLAWRAQWAGWESLYVPGARVTHHHSATSREGSPFKNRLLGRNKVWLIAKNYPMPYLWLCLPVIIGYDVASMLYAIAARRDISPLEGRIAGLRGLVNALRKRKTILCRITPRAMMALLAPVESPWRVLRRYRHLTPITPAPPAAKK